MKNPLDSLWGTVISGLILTADPVQRRQVRAAITGDDAMMDFIQLGIGRWLHISPA